MKKLFYKTAALGCAFVIAGCSGGAAGRKSVEIAALSTPPAGAYLDGTLIVMEAADADARIYYTLDGSPPSRESALYDADNPPVMRFSPENAALKLNALAVMDGGDVQTEVEYTQFTITLSPAMRALADEVQSSPLGASAENPVRIALGADTGVDDVALTFPNPQNPLQTIVDGMGQLFEAFGGKYIDLDLSAVRWTGEDDSGAIVRTIPDVNREEGIKIRPNKDKLVGVTLPAGLETIGTRSFTKCTNLIKVDLSGQSALRTIESYAFRDCYNLQEIIFDGCTALRSINEGAFRNCYLVTMIDLSPCVKLEYINDRAFRQMWKVKYIELPASLKGVGSYSFLGYLNLEYVRFRSLIQPDWGWAVFNYHDWYNASEWMDDAINSDDPKYGNGMKGSHRAKGVDGGSPPHTDHMFVIYHPNTSPWTKPHIGYFAGDAGGYLFAGQGVPLDDIEAGGAKGAALKNYAEPYRGLSSVTINAEGLDGVDGKTVSSNVDETAALVSGGAVSLVVGTPKKNLARLTEDSGCVLTGAYGEATLNNKPTPIDLWSGSEFQGKSGTMGKPWIIADGQVQFAILKLSVEGAGELTRRVEGAKIIDPWKRIDTDTRTINYVYVDRDVVITRSQRSDIAETSWLSTVSLSLKAGWNLVETCERYYDDGAKPYTGTALWISGGIYDANTTALDKNAPTVEDTKRDTVIPWTLKHDN